ncbi:aspartyl-phosphate phosphatase Spo0E family protein [Fervidibacillus albus]|uniref:Aspartyl-phosphate phosphatase Spo0E family protein n=1 Tax=Fervidibacillus albus TaxID=2980026 RepID=A0A9E8RYX9_9BACI|nr:aspartyl-phosphate phosphatase Spo0E family protein [Fervidibacillus albus]WAA11132.1 aspartyl-phosphate phosphatase Spo0E family protein [Fervidibacillus albus]
MKTEQYKKKMEMKITKKREEMISCARIFGYTAEETLQQSRELDELMNEYQRLFLHPRNKMNVLFIILFLFKSQFGRFVTSDCPSSVKIDY